MTCAHHVCVCQCVCLCVCVERSCEHVCVAVHMSSRNSKVDVDKCVRSALKSWCTSHVRNHDLASAFE